MANLPLAGVRVLDLSRVLAGPYCTMMLGDMGADVVKVEMPGSGDDTRLWGPPFAGGESAYYLCTNRNKRGITLNLKHAAGQRILRELVQRSDVLVENFKAGTLEGLGLGYEALAQINPRLVYCSISGYGREGPKAGKPGYDLIIQAEAGIMSFTGEADGRPLKVGVAIVDMTAGMFATAAVLAALRWRDVNGEGQRVDVSLLEAALAWLGNVGSNYLVSGEVPRRYGNAHANLVPYETFAAKDRHMVVGVGNDRQFRRFCEVLGFPGWADDPRFARNADRIANRTTLILLIQAVLVTKTADEWVAGLEAVGIPCGSINSLDRVFADPQVAASGIVRSVDHPTAGKVRLVGPPYHFSRTPLEIRQHPPLLGEHTSDILGELLGYDADDVRQLRQQGAV